MKTAMQELINSIQGSIDHPQTIDKQKYVLISIKLFAQALLEREKEQIIDAFDNGIYVGVHAVDTYGEQYYDQTYNEDSELPKEDQTFKQKSKWTKLYETNR